MDTVTKAKEWINQNAPMLSILYTNKYVGIGYDKFASLPAKQQRQILFGILGGLGGLLFLYLTISYYTLWSESREAREAYTMIDSLMQYQKSKRDKSQYLQHLERNSQLAGTGQFKEHVLSQAKQAGISQRFIQVEEKAELDNPELKKGEGDIKVKQVSVNVEKINLQQLKGFLTALEFGSYNLNIPTLQITNDSKIRGYMQAKFTVVAYLFQTEESL